MTKIKDVTRQGKLISFKTVARKCSIKRINAGRIVGRLKDHIDVSLIQETRQGPMNHICNWLFFSDQSAEGQVQIKKASTKTIYRRMISNKFITPKIQNLWQQVFHYARDLDWLLIWKNGFSNNLLDPEDRHFWFKLKHMILPTRDVLHKIGMAIELKCPMCETEQESHQHLFIYCIQTLNAWVFVEHLIRNYTGNNHFHLSDPNRILGYDLKPVQGVLIVKMLRLIWNIRCKKVFQSYKHPSDIDIIFQFKRTIKHFLILEKERMSSDKFASVYARNNTLCTINEENQIVFNY